MKNIIEFFIRTLFIQICWIILSTISWYIIFLLVKKLKKPIKLYFIFLFIYLSIYLSIYLLIYNSGPNIKSLDGAAIILGIIILPTLIIYSIVLITYLLISLWRQNKKKEEILKNESASNKKG